eukprot:TRINITY_DN676_c0_g2_i1.p1 TRINITY_DN676_c0_g2~~TRINITY_DN676_c0_g2_i1.p1  ORF type:complete len:212 (+),score=63.39 TRINITY_DN676_c0_g2_i1:657-1292(+)
MWITSTGTYLIVVDKKSGKHLRTFHSKPFFSFHHVNAYEEGDSIYLDLSCYEDIQIVNALFLDNLRDPSKKVPPSSLRRFKISMGSPSSEVKDETLFPGSFELPTIKPSLDGPPYQFTYGLGSSQEGSFFDSIIKIDVSSKKVKTWSCTNCFPTEPIFVGNPQGNGGEDDGVVLSVVLNPVQNKSFLLVLDAGSFETTNCTFSVLLILFIN